MKYLILLLAWFLFAAVLLCAQDTQTLVENDQLKVELTTGLERCPPGMGAAGFRSSSDPDASPTCTVLSITNKSGAPITAYAIIFGTGLPPAPNRVLGVESSTDSLPDRPTGLIPPGAALHMASVGTDKAELKAAIFADGSVFGEPEWIERIVQNRRETYQDTVIALQKLSNAKEAGTPREQLVQEFRHLQQQETKYELESARPHNSVVPPIVPKSHLFGDIAHELEWKHEGTGEDTLPDDIDRLESKMLHFGKLLLDSKPPITDRAVEPGQLLDSVPLPQ